MLSIYLGAWLPFVSSARSNFIDIPTFVFYILHRYASYCMPKVFFFLRVQVYFNIADNSFFVILSFLSFLLFCSLMVRFLFFSSSHRTHLVSFSILLKNMNLHDSAHIYLCSSYLSYIFLPTLANYNPTNKDT